MAFLNRKLSFFPPTFFSSTSLEKYGMFGFYIFVPIGLTQSFLSTSYFCYSFKACTWYALTCWVRLLLHFPLFCWLYFKTVDQKTTQLLQNAHTFQHFHVHRIKIYHFRASYFLFPSWLLDLQGPILFLFLLYLLPVVFFVLTNDPCYKNCN